MKKNNVKSCLKIKKMGPPLGNKNARKEGELASARIVMKIKPSLKNLIVNRAQSEGKNLTEWIIETIEAEIKRK